jgi:hypothetical protein
MPICKKCFEDLSTSSVTTLNPPLEKDAGSGKSICMDIDSNNDASQDHERGGDKNVSNNGSREFCIHEESDDADGDNCYNDQEESNDFDKELYDNDLS